MCSLELTFANHIPERIKSHDEVEHGKRFVELVGVRLYASVQFFRFFCCLFCGTIKKRYEVKIESERVTIWRFDSLLYHVCLE